MSEETTTEKANADRLRTLLEERELHQAREILISLPAADIAEYIEEFDLEESIVIFRILPRELATDIFEFLPTITQAKLVSALGSSRVAILLNEMAADDRTALFEEFPAPAVRQLLNLLSREERAVALNLLGYPESSVGRLMSPDYVAVQATWSIYQVLTHIRENGRDSDSLESIFVLDEKEKLIDELSIKEILLATPDRKVSDYTHDSIVSLQAFDDQEEAVQLFKKYGRTVLPVIDSNGLMLGIVTSDDVLEVAEEEATEDIQKFGGSEALEEPYARAPLTLLIKSRARWLIVLFIGEMFTASAMSYFEAELQRAVILALFVPLIISTGGNSGSQAATLVIRALSTGEIELSDWFRVLRRELFSGFSLGAILGLIGFARVVGWNFFIEGYGDHWLPLASTVGLAIVSIVLFGAVAGAMLPFILKKVGADPATSSAPFVATIVDVTGLVIYFSIASFILSGSFL